MVGCCYLLVGWDLMTMICLPYSVDHVKQNPMVAIPTDLKLPGCTHSPHHACLRNPINH